MLVLQLSIVTPFCDFAVPLQAQTNYSYKQNDSSPRVLVAAGGVRERLCDLIQDKDARYTHQDRVCANCGQLLAIATQMHHHQLRPTCPFVAYCDSVIHNNCLIVRASAQVVSHSGQCSSCEVINRPLQSSPSHADQNRICMFLVQHAIEYRMFGQPAQLHILSKS